MFYPSTKTPLCISNKAAVNKCRVTTSLYGSLLCLNWTVRYFHFMLSLFLVVFVPTLWGLSNCTSWGKLCQQGAPGALSLTLLGARAVPRQPQCPLSRALCGCSVNSSTKHSLWKESKSPSAEQTLKWNEMGLPGIWKSLSDLEQT